MQHMPAVCMKAIQTSVTHDLCINTYFRCGVTYQNKRNMYYRFAQSSYKADCNKCRATKQQFIRRTWLTFVLFQLILHAISEFRCSVNEALALLGCYATSIGIYRIFWTPLRPHLQGTGSPLKMGTTGCPETSVTNCQYTLLNFREERRS